MATINHSAGPLTSVTNSQVYRFGIPQLYEFLGAIENHHMLGAIAGGGWPCCWEPALRTLDPPEVTYI